MDEDGKKRFGDYELVGVIGDGAQGRVYKARPLSGSGLESPDRPFVAIKVLRFPGEDYAAKERFHRQVELLTELSHPNIVKYLGSFVWHAGDWDEMHAVVMEYLDGRTLRERLQGCRGGLPWQEVHDVFALALAGLLYAREHAVVHRDLKPSNLFVTLTGAVKLIDFDIAHHEKEAQVGSSGWKGTFDYMAPDFVALPDFVGDELSDVFSLGVCLYQALTGELPFEPLGTGAHIGYLKRWREEKLPRPSFQPGVFRVLENSKSVLECCLDSDRSRRTPGFAAVLGAIQTIRPRRLAQDGKPAYELTDYLGHGAFGEVLKGRRLSDDSPVAIKHLYGGRQVDRFMREARILRQSSHPNLVTYIDFIEHQGHVPGESEYFLILEFLDGMPECTLRNRISAGNGLPLEEALALFVHYAAALEFLHDEAHQIIHRDIKPGNLYAPIGHPERAKVFDLGGARDLTGTVTAGGVPGTLDYMAPEFDGPDFDRGSAQSDIYALGLCLYEALTGRRTFRKLTGDLQAVWTQFQERGKGLSSVDFSLPVFVDRPPLRAIITKCIAPSPSRRYQRTGELREHLAAVLAWVQGRGPEPVVDTAEALDLASAVDTEIYELHRDRKVHGLDDETGSGTARTEISVLEQALSGRPAVARRRWSRRTVSILVGVLVAVGAVAATYVWTPGLYDGVARALLGRTAAVRVAVELPVEFKNVLALPRRGQLGTGDSWRARAVSLNSDDDAVPLRPGDRTLELQVKGYETARCELSVDAGATAVAKFRLEPKPAQLILSTSEQDRIALVYEGDKQLGRTGEPLMLAPGRHVLMIRRKGFVDRDLTLDAGPGERMVRAVPPPSVNQGTVEIEILAENAHIGVADGIVRFGNDAGDDVVVRFPFPKVERVLPVGEHPISVSVRGYQAPPPQTVRVELGQHYSVVFRLVPLPCAVTVSCVPADAEVWEKDRRLGGGNQKITFAEAGQHVLEFRMAGFFPEERSVLLAPGTEASMAVTLRARPGTATVTSDPPDAEIWDGKERLGVTGEAIRVKPGRYEWEIRKSGYVPTPVTIDVGPEGAARLAVALRAQPGTVVVRCERPEDAEVWLGDERLGKAGDAFKVPAGRQRLSIRSTGYQALNLDVTVPPGGEAAETVRLEPTPAQLDVKCAVAAEVWFRETRVGQTNEAFPLAPGTYSLEVRKAGYKPFPLSVSLANGEIKSVGPYELIADVGMLRIQAHLADNTVGSSIRTWVRGEYKLDTGAWQSFVSPQDVSGVGTGPHTLAFRIPEYREVSPTEIAVTFGQATVVELSLIPLPARRAELGVLRALEAGALTYEPLNVLDPDLHRQAIELLAAAQAVQKVGPVIKVYRHQMLEYLKTVDTLWAVATSISGTFGEEVQYQAQNLIERKLLDHAGFLARSVEIASLGPPMQARVRRQFLELVALVKQKMGQTQDDPALQEVVTRYFDAARFHPALLDPNSGEVPDWEKNVPWLERMFTEKRAAQM